MSFLRFHLSLWIQLFTLLATLVTFVCLQGKLKPNNEINLLDTLGEGGLAGMTFIWLVVTLINRPKGKVTLLLFYGLTAMHVSMLVDFVDEFFHFPPHSWHSFEAFPALLGMGMMSLSLYFWHQEQQAINMSLLRKERLYRDHEHTDVVSGLYSAAYLKRQISLELNKTSPDFSLCVFDIKRFGHFNQAHGPLLANQRLADVAQLIRLGCRQRDLLCRLASDKFVLLMPATPLSQAQHIARDIKDLVAQLHSYQGDKKLAPLKLNMGCCHALPDEETTTLIARLLSTLNDQKQQAVA